MSLKSLYEISSLLTIGELADWKIESDSEEGETGSKYVQLIDGLGRRLWKNDEEALEAIYGSDTSNDQAFEMLKSRAKDRLINMIFRTDTAKYFEGSSDKAYFLACRAYLSGFILFGKSRFTAGYEQVLQALKSARNYHHTEIELIALRMLRRFESFNGDVSKFNKYNDELKKVAKRLEADLAVEELNQELQIMTLKSVEMGDDWMQLLEKNYSHMLEIKSKSQSDTMRYQSCRLAMRYFQSKLDFVKAIEVADDFQKYMQDNPKMYRRERKAEMNMNNLYSCLFLRDYINGSIYAEECEKLFNYRSINWLVFRENHFLLCMHTSNYEKAESIYGQVIQHPDFENYPQNNIEKWKIYEAYLSFVRPVSGTKGENKFNLSKFMNEVVVFTKDKAGYNLTVLIAQIILSAKHGNYERIVEKNESLKLYLSRYIKKERNPRSYYFLKMLQVMIRYDFDMVKTNEISGKFYQKLEHNIPGKSGGLEFSEVIPYEVLWKDLLRTLQTKQ